MEKEVSTKNICFECRGVIGAGVRFIRSTDLDGAYVKLHRGCATPFANKIYEVRKKEKDMV